MVRSGLCCYALALVSAALNLWYGNYEASLRASAGGLALAQFLCLGGGLGLAPLVLSVAGLALAGLALTALYLLGHLLFTPWWPLVLALGPVLVGVALLAFIFAHLQFTLYQLRVSLTTRARFLFLPGYVALWAAMVATAVLRTVLALTAIHLLWIATRLFCLELCACALLTLLLASLYRDQGRSWVNRLSP